MLSLGINLRVVKTCGNKTAETFVVVIVSVFAHFQKKTTVTQLQRLSGHSSNLWTCYTTQQNWTEQERSQRY